MYEYTPSNVQLRGTIVILDDNVKHPTLYTRS